MRERILAAVEVWGIPAWVVPDYTFMLVAAIAAGAFVTLRCWESRGRSVTQATWLLLAGVAGLLAGARLFSWLQFGFPRSWAEIWSGSGFALYGGLVGVLAVWALARWYRPYPFLELLDCAAPGLALGLCLGRIGCFMAGCDGGIPAGLPWAMRFPPGTSSFRAQLESGLLPADAELSVVAHPTQLYESLFGLVAFILLVRMQRIQARSGEVFLNGMFWYGVFRLASDPLRAATGGWRPAEWLSFAQLLSILLIAASLLGFRVLARSRK